MTTDPVDQLDIKLPVTIRDGCGKFILNGTELKAVSAYSITRPSAAMSLMFVQAAEVTLTFLADVNVEG